MKKRIGNSIISLLLVFAVFVTSIPLMSWTAIAQTIAPAVLAAEDDSVASTSADVSTAETGDITVDYPTSSNGYKYVEGNAALDGNDLNSIPLDSWQADYKKYTELGVFDPICYIQINTDLVNGHYATKNADGTITYNSLRLYTHWINFGISEGRCASPFFCIECYYCENEQALYDHCVSKSKDPNFKSKYPKVETEEKLIRMAAWEHFTDSNLAESSDRVLSPIFVAGDYKTLYPDVLNLDSQGKPNTKLLLEHFMGYGMTPTDLRRGSTRVDNFAYFYNNNSIFHAENGVEECYRKLIYELTFDETLITGNATTGCKYHMNKTYTGRAQLDDSFTGTLTSVGVMKNVAMNSDGTSAVSVTPGDTANELWQFLKQDNNTYHIKLANSDNKLTFDNTTQTSKYLCAEIAASSVKLKISDIPETQWYIYEVDGLYALRPNVQGSMYRELLNITDNGDVNLSNFCNLSSTSTNYTNDTMHQRFLINTTYETLADSDGLTANFHASIDAFLLNSMNTKVSLTLGDKYLRTRDLADGGTSAADQHWQFIRQSDGTYKILNTACSSYLTSSPGEHKIIKDNAPTVEHDYEYSACYVADNDNSDYQKWFVTKRDDGGYFIIPVHWQSNNFFPSGGFLRTVEMDNAAAGTGSLIYIDSFKGKKYSVFDINVTDDQPYAYDLNGNTDDSEFFYAYLSSGKVGYENYYLKNNETQYGVEKKFINASNEDIKKHDYYWKFERKLDGSYIINSTTTVDACLMVKDSKVYLDENTAINGLSKTWYLFKNNGGYRLQLKETGEVLVMDENGALTVAPANTNNYDDFQLFKIKETDMSIDTAAETFKMNLFNYGTRINDTSDPTHVLDFFNGGNDAVDKQYSSIGPGDGIIPEMSKVLDENNYPYVKNYAYVNTEPSGIVEGIRYEAPMSHEKTPNYYRNGSLQYLFDVSTGFVRGGDNSPITKYDPTAENGDEYQSQAFKVKNPSGLFTKEDGYFVYDSSKNSAYFDIDENSKADNSTLSGSFKVYDYLTHPDGNAPLDDINFQGMFLPFNLSHEDGTLSYDKDHVYNAGDPINYGNDSTKATKANYILPILKRGSNNEVIDGDREKAPDMWFGMTLETDFYQTHKGMLDNKPVKFEFSGDDDVWVYLDGILALDIGNTHGKISGEINFADSTVTHPVKTTYDNSLYAGVNEPTTVTYASNGEKGQMWEKNPDGTYKLETVSLYSVYYDAYEEVKGTDADKEAEVVKAIVNSFVTQDGGKLTADNLPVPNKGDYTADPVYKDYAEHNLKFFYLERGAGASNCKIRLNTFSGGTTVSKEVTGLNEEVMDKADYKFQAVYVDGEEETPIANSPYTLSSSDIATISDDGISTASDAFETDENGYFTLKANQKATFGKIPLGSNIKIREVLNDDTIKPSWKTFESGVEVKSGKGVATDEITIPGDKTLDIVFSNDYEPSQNITIKKIFNQDGTSDNYKPNKDQIYEIGYEILDKSENVVVNSKLTLHDNEEGTIEDIPVGYTYRIWEYTPANTKLNFESPVFKKNNEEAQSRLFVPQGAKPSTDSYIEGVAKNNTNDEITITNKLVEHGSMTVTFKYYNRKRIDGAPAQINSYASSYKKTLQASEWEKYLNSETQRIDFSLLIANQGILFNEEVGVDNIIDKYEVWTSQAEAEKGFAQQTNYFAGKKDDGTYSTYADTNPSELAYHTDAFGNIANDGEKWVTYYQGGTVIDPEKQGNDTDVTAITVWLFNRPKEYTANLYTIDPNHVERAFYNSEKDIIIGTDQVQFTAFYNQRIGNNPDNESPELDKESSDEYLSAYQISDSDIVSGTNLNTNATVEYIDMPTTVTREEDKNSEPYTFLYWSYDDEGRFVASTSFNYAYRITNDITLYAVYGKTGLQFPGLTSFKNGIDYYYNSSGDVQVRLNTMMNPYNCPDYDDSITEAAVMYVMLHGAEDYKGMGQDELLAELSKVSANGMTQLDVLREDIRRILLNENARAVATQKSGQVTFIDVEVTASGFKYYVENSNGTSSSALNLTSKNRLQFTTEFSKDKLVGKHMLAFTAMKRNDSWIVSDNYVDYNFVNGFNS